MALFHFVWGVEQKDRPKPKRPSVAVMGGHEEELQRPCGDQPETSVRRGQPQASDGPRLRGWVSFSLLDLPGVLGLRSREGCDSQAFLDRSGSKALPHALLLTARISKAADSDRPACWLTSPSGRKYITHVVKQGNSSVGAGIRGVAEKGNTFYDDVMQAVFSFFFSFLLLLSP